MKTPLAIALSVIAAAGALAANQLGAQTATQPPASTTTSTGAPIAASAPTVQTIVEITRAVPAGTAAVDAFTVPAGVTLVVTDVIVTNTGTTAACGGAVNRGGISAVATTTTPTPATTATTSSTIANSPTIVPPTSTITPSTSTTATNTGTPMAATAATIPGLTASNAGTLTQTDSTVTGPLCVPAQTTTTLPLTTGIEFGGGQVVQLLNVPAAAAPTVPAARPGSLAFHLRGVLITLG